MGPFLAAAIPSLVQAGASLLGGLFHKKPKAPGIDLAKLRRDAEKNGFNPLTVLAANGGSSYTPQENSSSISTGEFLADALGSAVQSVFDASKESTLFKTGQALGKPVSVRALTVHGAPVIGDRLNRNVPSVGSVSVSVPALSFGLESAIGPNGRNASGTPDDPVSLLEMKQYPDGSRGIGFVPDQFEYSANEFLTGLAVNSALWAGNKIYQNWPDSTGVPNYRGYVLPRRNSNVSMSLPWFGKVDDEFTPWAAQ